MKEKTTARIKREANVKKYIEEMLIHCASGKPFLHAKVAAKHHIGTPTYKAAMKFIKKTEDSSKIYVWNTDKTTDQIVEAIVGKKKTVCTTFKKGKDTIHSSVKLDIPNKVTKSDAAKAVQTVMKFEGASKIHRHLSNQCKLTVTVREEMGGSATAKTYVVDPAKFMFEDVDKTIQAFRNESKE